jgi:hypothetical protein
MHLPSFFIIQNFDKDWWNMKIKKHTKEEERRLKDEGEFSP